MSEQRERERETGMASSLVGSKRNDVVFLHSRILQLCTVWLILLKSHGNAFRGSTGKVYGRTAQHVTRHQKGYWNGIWSDMFIESTFMCYGKGPGSTVEVTLQLKGSENVGA